MIVIGIESNQNIVYEGDGYNGRAVWPTPVITHARFILPSGEILQAEPNRAFDYRFREDSFDPVSRVRRGRFYRAEGQQPKYWKVTHHPGAPLESLDPYVHVTPKSLETFHGNPLGYQIGQKMTGQALPLVRLGLDDRFTVWTIISMEAISTGEDLVTLKARSSFGVLPEIKQDKVPEAFKAKLKESLATFADEVHRASPESVIDRAREAASQALLAYYDLRGSDAKDLGKLVNRLESEEKVIASNTARIVARLHARAKSSEQEKHQLRPIREQDAELAIECLGTLLCELGIAEWA